MYSLAEQQKQRNNLGPQRTVVCKEQEELASVLLLEASKAIVQIITLKNNKQIQYFALIFSLEIKIRKCSKISLQPHSKFGELRTFFFENLVLFH